MKLTRNVLYFYQIVNDEGKYKIQSDGTLQIIGVSRMDAGSFTCIADNGVGTSAIKQTQLEVKGMCLNIGDPDN